MYNVGSILDFSAYDKLENRDFMLASKYTFDENTSHPETHGIAKQESLYTPKINHRVIDESDEYRLEDLDMESSFLEGEEE
jgi:hypothetical protein